MARVEGSSDRYLFADLTLDIGQRRVWRGDRPVSLAKLSFDCLRVLVESAPNVVPHEELARKVWGSRRVVTPENLAQRLWILRKSLGDAALEPRYIESSRGQGYRLIPPVELDNSTQTTLQHVQSVPAARGTFTRSLLGLGVVIGLSMIGAFFWTSNQVGDAVTVADDSSVPRIEPQPNSIAILPFDHLGAKPSGAFIAEAVHAEVINALGKNDNFLVIARGSVLHYAEKTFPVQQIAKELNVDMIIQGSIRYVDDRAHLIVELLDADSGLQLWTSDYDGTAQDIFSIRSDMTEKISAALGTGLSVDELARLGRLPTMSADAYAFYLRAMDEFSEDTFGSRSTAQTFLDQAIALDSQFAHAYAAKALIYAYAAINSPDSNSELPASAADREQLIRDYAALALAINPDTDLAHYALGVLGMFTRNWGAARDGFERAVTLAPQDAGFLAQYAWFKSCALDEPDGLRFVERATALDPQNPRVYELKSRVQDCMGDNLAAFASIEQALALDPTAFGRRFDRAMLAPHVFAPEAAAQQLRNLEPLLTDQRLLYLPAIALTFAELGYQEDASRVFERFAALSEGRGTGSANWVTAYLAIDETDLAFKALEQAVDEFALGPGIRTLMAIRGNLRQAPILEEPRFVALRAQLGSLDELSNGDR